MEFFNEYALLFAVATPVVVIAAMNLALYFAGERETLLVPGVRAFPVIEFQQTSPVPAFAEVALAAQAAANDERALEAA